MAAVLSTTIGKYCHISATVLNMNILKGMEDMGTAEMGSIIELKNENVTNGGGIRVDFIDALKGFAILCVVLGHVLDGYLKANIALEARTFMERLIDVINSFHMPLFMMISGYVFCMVYFDEFGQPKKARIYQQVGNQLIVYIFYAAAFGVLKILIGYLGGGINSEITFVDVLLILVRPYAPYWYLYVLIVLYLLFSVKKVQAVNRYCCLAIIALVATVSSVYVTKWFALSSILYFSFFFYLGILRRKYPDWLDRCGITLGFFCVAVVVSVVVMHFTRSDVNLWISSIPAVNIIVGLGISFGLWYSFKHISFLTTNRLLKFLGRSSLEIYVIHCIFTAGFRILFSKAGITNAYVSIFLNFFLSTSIPISFAFLCKRLGIYGILFKPYTTILELRQKR